MLRNYRCLGFQILTDSALNFIYSILLEDLFFVKWFMNMLLINKDNTHLAALDLMILKWTFGNQIIYLDER